MDVKDLDTAFQELSQEVRDLSIPAQVPRLAEPPDPITFLREYVAQNRPFLVEGGAAHWPAMYKWTPEYLAQQVGDKLVTVDVTPDGRGDAVARRADGSHWFVTPDERRMRLQDFLELLAASRAPGGGAAASGVPYVQHQNGSFLEEFEELVPDAATHLPWATAALGAAPDAVNLWIGDHRAVTSLHKDHYENLYAVVAGTKHFTLLPPADCHRVYTQTYPAGTYQQDAATGAFAIQPADPPREVAWSPVDPHPRAEGAGAAREQFPRFFSGPAPVEVAVAAGDLLYLPAMWFHHVRQQPDPASGLCVAVNFWYDMAYDFRFTYFGFLEKLVAMRAGAEGTARPEETEEDGCTGRKYVKSERRVERPSSEMPVDDGLKMSRLRSYSFDS